MTPTLRLAADGSPQRVRTKSQDGGMTRRSFAAGIIGLAGFPAVARAQNALPVIGLSSTVSSEATELSQRAGLRGCVAKFDRRALIAALKNETCPQRLAS